MNLAHALNVRSDFSLGKSLLQVDHIIEQAKLHGYDSVALVDDMSLHNMVDFCARADKAGIKPIIGVTLRVMDDPTQRKSPKKSGIVDAPNPMVMLKAYVVDARGVASLLKLLSKANSAEYFYYVARTGWDDVLALEGVAITTGDFFNLWHHPRAGERLSDLLRVFGPERVFCELVPVDTPLFDTLNARAITIGDAAKAAFIASTPFLYRDDADAASLDVLGVITSASKMSTPWRSIQYVTNFGFRPPLELARRVASAHRRAKKWNGIDNGTLWKNALANVGTLANLCQYRFAPYPVSLPSMAENEFETLARKCFAGWAKRFARPVLGHLPAPGMDGVYRARLRFELAALKAMGFAGYFLLVEDLVNWSKRAGIFVGPGRGSVGGSLVAYLLGITDIDPVRFGLIFERFINPERADLPDADLDFMSSRRAEIVTYLTDKYGFDRVAGISNYSTLASASALRDTGRVFELDNIALSATKLVPKEHGLSCTLTEAADMVPELEQFRARHGEVWNHALKLEGVLRSFGRHAAGVVVGGCPLLERAVVETREKDDVPIVNWDKRTVEKMGLVKMDILGLSTLDVLDIARQYIRERHAITVDYTALPLEQADIMAAFARGDTIGVFQYESSGMRRLLRDLAKSTGTLTFEDITAASALYRPGPMDSGLMADFVRIKQGERTPYYEHPNMVAALSPTYSVIVYQEQVMQLAVDLAGFSRAEADHLRSAMGKKDMVKMVAMRERWIDGCMSTSSMGSSQAGELFDKIEAFAGYGFNKSHAVSYAVVSYWTMWVRVRYPAEYFAACLSVVADDKLSALVLDARACGIEVLPPDINASSERFTIPDDHHLRTPFGRMLGCSDNTARRIVELREGARALAVDEKGKAVWGEVLGRFVSDAHFSACAAQKNSKVNALVVERLRLVGAMASVQSGTPDALALERRRDQIALLPGLIIDAVKADRQTDVADKFLRARIIHIVQEYRACSDCDLAGQPHPAIRMKSTVKFMVVADCPSWQEEKHDKLFEGDGAAFVRAAMANAGLAPSDGYYTALVKSKKEGKFLSNGQINGCARFLAREIDTIKPAIIIALGSATIKHLLPGIKGSTAELAGKAVYDPKLDVSIVCGINPAQILFDPSKMAVLEAVFARVAEMLA